MTLPEGELHLSGNNASEASLVYKLGSQSRTFTQSTVDAEDWTDIGVSYDGRTIVTSIGGSVQSQTITDNTVAAGNVIKMHAIGKFFHFVFWPAFMTADELDDCMDWISPPPPEECPKLNLTVNLNESSRFGGANSGAADVDGIWSPDGLYLEGVDAWFEHPRFSSTRSMSF